VVILADDLGWQDVALPLWDQQTPLNRRYRTPNIARLAAEGMKFTDAYAAAPVCTPTRVTEITGRSPAETRVTNWVQFRDKETSAPYPILLPPPWNMNGVSPTAGAHSFTGPILPRILREAGYKTIHVGKGHWGAFDTPGADPHTLGFDVNIGGSAASLPASYLGRRNYGAGTLWAVPDLAAYHGTDTFLTEALTIEANKAIDQAVAEGRPFFLHFAHFAVHTPIQADARFVNSYRAAGVEPVEAAYASLIEGMDKSVGDVLANIARHGLASNTFVLFTSDNGGLAAQFRGGTAHTQNAPLRSGKGSAYEGGLRVPFVVRWPGRVKAGTTSRIPVITDDIFPTMLTLARVPDGAHYTTGIRGRDLVPMLTGGASVSADRPLLWHFPHRVWNLDGPGLEPFSAARVGPWKLIFFYADRRYELYNLATDIGEVHNVLDTNRQTAARISKVLHDGLQGANAQTPLDPATKLPVDLPPVIVSSSVARQNQ